MAAKDSAGDGPALTGEGCAGRQRKEVRGTVPFGATSALPATLKTTVGHEAAARNVLNAAV
jgi:hypothetical protein